MPSRRHVLESDGERARPRAYADDHAHLDDLTARPGGYHAQHPRPLPAAEQRRQPVELSARAIGCPGQDLPDWPGARQCLGEKPGELTWPFARTFQLPDRGGACHRVRWHGERVNFLRSTLPPIFDRARADLRFTVKRRSYIGHSDEPQGGQVVDLVTHSLAHVTVKFAARQSVLRGPLRW